MSDNLVIGGTTFSNVTGIKATDVNDVIKTFTNGLTLLGSGSYTKASQSTSLSIPVTYTGTPKLFYMYVPEPVADTGQTVFCARWVDVENDETDAYTRNGMGFGMYTVRNATNAVTQTTPTAATWPGITSTTLTFGRAISYANYLANTYKWFIYG